MFDSILKDLKTAVALHFEKVMHFEIFIKLRWIFFYELICREFIFPFYIMDGLKTLFKIYVKLREKYGP